MSSQPSTPSAAEQATGTKETTYALVSVLDHALQGAETLGHDLQDAEAAGDQELGCSSSVRRRRGSGTWRAKRRPSSSSGCTLARGGCGIPTPQSGT